MSILSKLAGAAVIASVACGASQATRKRMTPKEIVAKSKPAIVRVELTDGRVGTGFLIDDDGLVATNLHVVAGADKINIKLADGSSYPVEHVMAVDPGHDLALLSIDANKDLPILRLGDSDKVAAGDPVLAIGNPLGVLDYTVSDGLISSVRVIKDDKRPEISVTILQISAPISQGSSGGPLLNPYGEVIGVTTAIFKEGQNLNFAVPSNYLKPLVAQQQKLTMPEFAQQTKPLLDAIGGGPEQPDVDEPDVKITRAPAPIVDNYSKNAKLLDSCDMKELDGIETSIKNAIAAGAPLYNAKKIKACFQIYESTSVEAEKTAKCRPVRDTFGHGLKRVGTLKTFKEKAWALRDTFDSVLIVIHAKRTGQPIQPQPIP